MKTDKCKKCNVTGSNRGRDTRREMTDDSPICPQFGPKLVGVVDMGVDSIIEIKVARSGVPGNGVRTDWVKEMLDHHIGQDIWDRTALETLR